MVVLTYMYVYMVALRMHGTYIYMCMFICTYYMYVCYIYMYI
jgi:hypothetical protein